MAKFVNSACCWGIRGWHPLRSSEGSASSLLRCLVISDHLDARGLRALRQHCITYRHDSVIDITKWAQEYFQKPLSVNTIRRAICRCQLCEHGPEAPSCPVGQGSFTMDCFKVVHHGKHAPVPSILRPVAGIKFEMSSFCAYNCKMSHFKHLLCYLCSIVNKILAHVIWKSFSFHFIQI